MFMHGKETLVLNEKYNLNCLIEKAAFMLPIPASGTIFWNNWYRSTIEAHLDVHIRDKSLFVESLSHGLRSRNRINLLFRCNQASICYLVNYFVEVRGIEPLTL